MFSADRYLVCSFRCSQYRSVALRQLRRFHPGCACCAACDISDYHQECPELVLGASSSCGGHWLLECWMSLWDELRSFHPRHAGPCPRRGTSRGATLWSQISIAAGNCRIAPAAAGERDLETLESSALKPWPLACSAEYGSLSNPISGTRTGLAMP